MDVGHDGTQVEDLDVGLVPAPEDQQLTGEPGGPLCRGLDLVHIGSHRLVPGGRLGHEGGTGQDDRQQVVEVVCHAAGELAQALQPLPLVQAVLQPLPLRPSLQPLLDDLVIQGTLVRFLKLPGPFCHGRLERGVQLL